jgi:2'-5' RNA ligase
MSRGPTARLLVAVDPPPPVCEELAVWARSAAAGLGLLAAKGADRPLRLLEPGALHLTLCFLGSRPVHEIEAIGSALSSCAASVGELSVGAPLWLPPRRPRVLAVEVHDSGEGLLRLQRIATQAISQASGWEPERRRFRAHITVARVREGRAAKRRPPGGRLALPATPQLRFTPEAIVLYRSRLDPAGATYEALATCFLEPSGADHDIVLDPADLQIPPAPSPRP